MDGYKEWGREDLLILYELAGARKNERDVD